MIIGDLDLDWAEQDPAYLARVKAFLISTARDRTAPLDQPPPPGGTMGNPDSAAPEHAV